jgi:cyclase
MAANAERIGKMVDSQTKIVPGHGPVARKQDVKDYADMLAACLESLTKAVKSGKTLEQVQAAQPCAAYDEKWGRGFVKPEQWIAVNYAGLTIPH